MSNGTNWDLMANLGLGVMNIFMAVYVFIANKNTAKDDELQETKERVSVVEERLKTIPDHKDISDMAGNIKALGEKITALKDAMRPMERKIDSMSDYLMNNK